MLTTIAKTFDFDAAHRLGRQPKEHKCHRLHGHTYRVEIRARGKPDRRYGMVVDYALIAEAWQSVHAKIDHRTLLHDEDPVAEALYGLGLGESVVPFPFETTTENLAEWIEQQLKSWQVEIHKDEPKGVEWKSLGGLSLAVRVYESSTTYAEVGRT